MIHRTITSKILELKEKYPVISITGPRQSGKTSLAQELFPNYIYYNLENLDSLALAKSDPKNFMKVGSGKRIIIDEVQKFPELLSYIQVEVDAQKIDGQFVITGSQNFSIAESISQSLAGRVANFTLLPLSYSEVRGSTYSGLFAESKQSILRGFYPRSLVKDIHPEDFYRDYLSTYVERDVRQIKNVGDLSVFQKFLQLLAGRVGQLVNFSSLANDVGVNYKTIKSWLSILEASYIVYSLQPYYENFGKRITKSPKIYFCDTGLLCHLLKINSVNELETHYAYGQIFENFVITEVYKSNFNLRKNEQIYFWRDSNGNEVDMVIDRGENKSGIEIKAGQTFNSEMLKGLLQWQSLDPQKNVPTTLVYNGELEQQVNNHEIINWKTFLSVLD
ncbi:MAG: ATP-binding protein [Patescibacteria group bacterium]